MRTLPILGFLSLILAPLGSSHADLESAWFNTEAEALHALSNGDALPVLECDRCDADDSRHRMTAEMLRQVLGEFQSNDLPARGSFVLRERAAPRYTSGHALAEAGQSSCPGSEWTPSLTLWRYDLPDGWVEPVFSACLPFLDDVSTLRVTCADCDLERLEPMKPLLENLREALASWAGGTRSTAPVRSGELLVTDPTDRGFRRVDFRAYGSRVYLGPDEGQTEVVTLDMDPTRALAGAVPEGTPP